MELIRLENIDKTYHLGEVDVPVLRGISLSIARGEMVALMGASGSGKTTLMNLLGCLDRPSAGKYWFDGQEMSRLTPNQRALVRTALVALRRNKLRSALTALGVIIGVGAVIAMMEIGEGSNRALQKTISSMGANTLLVQSGAATSGGVSFGSGSVLTPTPQPIRFANVDQILVKAASAQEISQAIAQITDLLRERHRIHPGDTDDFNIRDMAEVTKALAQTSQLMGSLLLVVALISLVVGGVGIMNIMLVSVTERTREIGLRMAVGARSYHILRQFLVEAVVLCLLGGAMGIVLGRGASILVRSIMRWPTEASLPAILAAVAVSATVGVVFGYYPAWKASRLDPIEALRYE